MNWQEGNIPQEGEFLVQDWVPFYTTPGLLTYSGPVVFGSAGMGWGSTYIVTRRKTEHTKQQWTRTRFCQVPVPEGKV